MKREVVQYLLLQKDEIKNDRAEKYIKMAENHEGHTCIRDAYDRAIATIFELVIDEELNPWEIDLASFSKMYLKRIKPLHQLFLCAEQGQGEWMMLWIGIVIGLFLGANLGVIVLALCMGAKQAENQVETH